MTPNQTKLFCTHAPYYQKGCIVCSARYVKMLRPSREKQDAYLAGLPVREAEQVKEMPVQERAQ
ncbi:MAG: hypothetical protein CL536_07950 [Alcaligenaceae bacterium]|nr:hypothetical protein [Alcaligenaceae bacterium]